MISKSVTKFQVIDPREFTEQDRAILRSESRRRVRERLEAMLLDGRIAASVMQSRYRALMCEIGRS